MGEGEFPDVLDGINWAAFFLSFLWAFGYGVLPWAWGILALRIAGSLALGLAQMAGPFKIAASVGWALVLFTVDGYFALNANRLAWQRAGAQLQSGRARRVMTVDQFIQNTRTWTTLGAVIFVGLRVWEVWRTGRVLPSAVPALLASAAVVIPVLVVLWAIDRNRASSRRLTKAST
jgi:hypothetical protein